MIEDGGELNIEGGSPSPVQPVYPDDTYPVYPEVSVPEPEDTSGMIAGESVLVHQGAAASAEGERSLPDPGEAAPLVEAV